LELPESCEHVWKWFIDLNSTRSSNGFSPNAITYNEMHSYFTLINMVPEEWELDLIKLLDRTAMNHFAKEADKKSKTKN
jgi:hypothetical protein